MPYDYQKHKYQSPKTCTCFIKKVGMFLNHYKHNQKITGLSVKQACYRLIVNGS